MPTETSDREERFQAIKTLLETRAVRRQGELGLALRALGFDVGQSSISRDLHELGIAKVKGRYVLAPAPAPESGRPASFETALAAVVRASVTAIALAGPNLLVVHTVAGAASAVGLAVDQGNWPDVVGTVAGDDTVFIATSGRRGQLHLLARLKHLKEGIETHV